ncbi:MAG: ATP-dependent DNA helicase RecG [Candidatus Abawacabacteria bacterium]|nr:ATP-dependent DNA helicase RecG [Candidatus Abawacabacteria bacterium]
MLRLDSLIIELPRVGEQMATKLHKLGIFRLRDLLTHFPRTYDNQTEIRKVVYAVQNEQNTLRVTINQIKNVRTKYRKVFTEAKVSDDSGSLQVVWFNQPYLINQLKVGMEVILSGKLKFGFGRLSMQSPEVEIVKSEQIHTGRLVPIYPETEGVSSKWLRAQIHSQLAAAGQFQEFLPEHIREQYGLVSRAWAIQQIHFPDGEKEVTAARFRLAFEEMLMMQLSAQKKRLAWQEQSTDGKAMPLLTEMVKEFVGALAFKLTQDQKVVTYEILKDMEKHVPMLRMLQGDVGSGKTIVAAVALFQAVKSGFQGAIMAPTEILARQHAVTLFPLFSKYGIRIELLVGSTTEKQKQEIVIGLKNKTIDIIVGTHAIIQETVGFANLGLAIVDEQHRFGVQQRARLKAHGSPHLLLMTATPIPRSLALTLYGDQDLSLIKELPPGRKPIVTRVIAEKERKKAYLFIDDQITKGRQIFVVCPLIEESDLLEVKAATQEYEKLQNEIFPQRKVGLLHGKMKPKEKDEIMQQFIRKELDILVSTAVIEVGVNVPNATIMMIEGADRFGLAQLHQFRGRVGRGDQQSYCLLFTDSNSSTVYTRLKAMEKHHSGFDLAELDLQLRGPGEIYGTKQSGLPDFKMASLTDSELIYKTRTAAISLLSEDPTLEKYPDLKREWDTYQAKRQNFLVE